MNNNISFSDIDGLVLATIYSNPGNDILSWLVFIDFYYKIMISYDELRSSMEKLQKSGLVILEDNAFCCTERTTKLLTGRDKMGITSWIFKVQSRLVKTSFEEEYDVKYTLLKSEYDLAIEKIYASFK